MCCIEIHREEREKEGDRKGEKGGERGKREREGRIGKREREGGKKKKKQREAERERQVDRLTERKRETCTNIHSSKHLKIKFKDHIHYTNYHTELANQVRHEQKPPAILHDKSII